jgi:hypothetical protein
LCLTHIVANMLVIDNLGIFIIQGNASKNKLEQISVKMRLFGT